MNTKVLLETTQGNIVLALHDDKAPATVKNFVDYVNRGHYEGTIFHRVIPNFMIQGGGFTTEGRQKDTVSPIQNEADNGLKNVKYTVAMARTNDPHSATAQFFINVFDNSFLNHIAKHPAGWGYTVFGEVVEGKEICDSIASVKTGNKGFHQDWPLVDIVIKKASVLPTEAQA